MTQPTTEPNVATKVLNAGEKMPDGSIYAGRQRRPGS
jgi:hypothetical protein